MSASLRNRWGEGTSGDSALLASHAVARRPKRRWRRASLSHAKLAAEVGLKPWRCSFDLDRLLSADRSRIPAISARSSCGAGSTTKATTWSRLGGSSVDDQLESGRRHEGQASPRAQRIHFAFNSFSKMLVSASTAARHCGRSHAGLLGSSQQWSLRTAFSILSVMAVGRQSARSKMGLSLPPRQFMRY
jgi:hypothetical protein